MTAVVETETLTPEQELEAFKKRVIVVAKRYARNHNWCAVVDQCLEELGLDPNSVQEYWVEEKRASYYDFSRIRHGLPFFTQEEARAKYDQLMTEAFNSHLLSEGDVRVVIDPRGKTTEQIQAEVTGQAEAIAAKLAAVRPPAYPKYRIRTSVNGRESTVPIRAAATTTETPARPRARRRPAAS